MAISDYLSRYVEFATCLPGQDLAWLCQLRADALKRFSAGGFPSPREEEWKYTNVAVIERKLFTPKAADSSFCPPLPSGQIRRERNWIYPEGGGQDSPQSEGWGEGDLQSWQLPDAYRLVFVDGHLNINQSLLPDAGVTGLALSLKTAPESVQAWLGQNLAEELHGFIHFNTAWFTDGAVVHLSSNCKLDKPLQLLFHASAADSMAVLRNLIVLEAGAEAEIIETYTGTAAYLTATVNEISLAENAKLTLTKLQCESSKAYHFGGNYVRQAKTSVFEHHNFAFGGLLARTEVHADLAQNSDCQLNGLFLAQNQQHLDNHIRVDHREADTLSRETYKGILNNRARGVFQGRVVVHPSAQRSNAAMNNRNLLLSADAEIDTKPQLEIYADDVKCSHGVTIGQLDDESVFFLQSRGLDEAAARGLLTFAFANEMVDKIANPDLCAMVRQQLCTRFPGDYGITIPDTNTGA